MRKAKLALIAILMWPLVSHADWFYTLVGFTCDKEANRLVIHYRGAYNEDGKAMLQRKSRTEWGPGELIASMRDDDHIGSLRTVQRMCRLKGANYTIRIGATPGNWNIQGSCGATTSAWVEVRQNGRVVLPPYELQGDCHDSEAPITTQIAFNGKGGKPIFKKVLPDEFLGRLKPMKLPDATTGNSLPSASPPR